MVTFVVRRVLPGLLFLVGSCNMLTPLAFVLPDRTTVSPELDKLPNSRVAILVWTDPSTLFDYPYARFELATFVGDKLYGEMARRELNTQLVDPRDVEDFLQKNPTARIDPQALGRAFDTDYVIYIEVLRFQVRDSDHPQFLRGRINASVSVQDMAADPDQLRRFVLTPVECTYPDLGPVVLNATNSPYIREQTYRKFAEIVARKFYEHTIER